MAHNSVLIDGYATIESTKQVIPNELLTSLEELSCRDKIKYNQYADMLGRVQTEDDLSDLLTAANHNDQHWVCDILALALKDFTLKSGQPGDYTAFKAKEEVGIEVAKNESEDDILEKIRENVQRLEDIMDPAEEDHLEKITHLQPKKILH